MYTILICLLAFLNVGSKIMLAINELTSFWPYFDRRYIKTNVTLCGSWCFCYNSTNHKYLFRKAFEMEYVILFLFLTPYYKCSSP